MSRRTIGLALCCVAMGGMLLGCQSVTDPSLVVSEGSVVIPDKPVRLPAQQESLATALALYGTGIHYELSENYPAALDYYTRAAQLEPDNEQFLLRQLSTLLLQRDVSNAMERAFIFIEKYPSSKDIRLWLANVSLTTGQLSQAEDIYKRMTRDFPQDPNAWIRLTEFLLRADRTEEALTVLEEGNQKTKPDPTIRPLLAALYVDAADRPETPVADAARLRKKALPLYQLLVKDSPSNVDFLTLLGKLYIQEGQLAEAIRAYQQIENLYPDNYTAIRKQLALYFLQAGNADEAIQTLRELAEKNPEESNFHAYLGELYLELGNKSEAAIHFQAAADAAPTETYPWITLAILQAETNYAQATETLDSAIQKMPEESRLYEVKALLLIEQEKYEEADESLQQAWQRLPTDAEAQGPDTRMQNSLIFNSAFVATKLHRIDSAVEWLQRALQSDSYLLELYGQRAITQSDDSMVDAGEILQKLTDNNPRSAFAHAVLGMLYLSKNEYQQACEQFDLVMEIAGGDPLQIQVLTPRFYFLYAIALDENEQTDRAIDMLQQAIQLDGRYAEARNYLAYTWALRSENLYEALLHVQIALAIDPENTAYIDTLGWVYYKLGRHPEALIEIEKADRLRPGDPEIQEHLQAVREALGLSDAAPSEVSPTP